jgi:hypothetical protein
MVDIHVLARGSSRRLESMIDAFARSDNSVLVLLQLSSRSPSIADFSGRSPCLSKSKSPRMMQI